MGRKNKYLIIILFFLTAGVSAQERPDFRYTDSLTYRYYQEGSWDSLITEGKKAVKSGTDYKFLRQRLGYAYFIKGNYYSARHNLERALKYDSYNPFTLEYLYYSYLNTGKDVFAGPIKERFQAGISSFRLAESLELEYNYKYSGTSLRSDPQYLRFGFSTGFGHRVKLFQSFSYYSSQVRAKESLKFLSLNQRGYYAALSLNAGRRLIIKPAYNHTVTSYNGSEKNGNLFLLSAASDFNRFSAEASFSTFRFMNEDAYQSGLQVAYVIPSRMDLYVRSNGAFVFRGGERNFVWGQAAGFRIGKKAWIEGNITSGNMDRYNDFTGLYVYNGYDPLFFRAGGTFIYYLGEKLSFWLNYSLEKKKYYEDNTFSYNQFSYLGGFKWKL